MPRRPPRPEVLAVLDPLRAGLLELHRLLIDAERRAYEQTFGPVPHAGALLQLLIHDPWFAWLRPFTQLIVRIDESLEEKEPISLAAALPLLREAWALLDPNETGTEHQRRYFRHLQGEPPILMAHADLKRILVHHGAKPSSQS